MAEIYQWISTGRPDKPEWGYLAKHFYEGGGFDDWPLLEPDIPYIIRGMGAIPPGRVPWLPVHMMTDRMQKTLSALSDYDVTAYVGTPEYDTWVIHKDIVASLLPFVHACISAIILDGVTSLHRGVLDYHYREFMDTYGVTMWLEPVPVDPSASDFRLDMESKGFGWCTVARPFVEPVADRWRMFNRRMGELWNLSNPDDIRPQVLPRVAHKDWDGHIWPILGTRGMKDEEVFRYAAWIILATGGRASVALERNRWHLRDDLKDLYESLGG